MIVDNYNYLYRRNFKCFSDFKKYIVEFDYVKLCFLCQKEDEGFFEKKFDEGMDLETYQKIRKSKEWRTAFLFLFNGDICKECFLKVKQGNLSIWFKRYLKEVFSTSVSYRENYWKNPRKFFIRKKRMKQEI